MIKLRKILSDSSKNERHRHNLFNIHITFLGWLVEFVGIFVIILGSFILGHSSPFTTLILQTLTITIYFNILPLVFLINHSDLKSDIADSKYYYRILEFFNSQHHRENEVVLEDEEEDR